MSNRPAFASVFSAAKMPGDPRKAALLLHAVPEPDQSWLLAQLPPGERELLQGLLEELKELGIPRARDVLLEVVSTPAEDRPPGPGAVDAQSPEAVVDVADPVVLACLLAHEPAGLIVRLLQIRAWPWAASLVASLGDSVRREVELRLREHADSGPPRAAPAGAAGRTRSDAELLRLLGLRLAAYYQGGLTISHGAPRSPGRASFASRAWWQRLRNAWTSRFAQGGTP